MKNFNPRTREGCDRVSRPFLGRQISISIHAPVKGATIMIIVQLFSVGDFNPRTREGCDVGELDQYAIIWVFQSTHP